MLLLCACAEHETKSYAVLYSSIYYSLLHHYAIIEKFSEVIASSYLLNNNVMNIFVGQVLVYSRV